MDYSHINTFFNKFKTLFFKEEEIYKLINITISKHIKSLVNPKDIRIKGTIIYIKSSPIIRNEILIHKEEILKDLKYLIIDRNFTNIN